jgi:hypothetical protein
MTMPTAKDEVRRLLEALPEDATLEDFNTRFHCCPANELQLVCKLFSG